MAKFTMKDGEVEVPQQLIARMADRMHRVGGKERRENYAKNAQRRIEKGSKQPIDLAIVLAARG